MARNAILLLSTLALFGALFLGYLVVVQDPVLDAGGDSPEILPVDRGRAGEALRLPGVEVPSGGGVSFTIYHRETGRPVQRFECEEWTPVADAKDEVYVRRPRLTMWLPSGMIATMSADEGQLQVEDLEKVQGRPRAGWLKGNVELLLDRSRERQRTPLSERPQDEILAMLDQIDFDFESGELRTDGPIKIVGHDFELAGVGLHLVWNQADNVIQSLTLREGERLVLYGGGGLLRNEDENAAAAEAATAEEAMAAATSVKQVAAPKQRRPKKAQKAYLCVLPDGVTAYEFKGETTGGGLVADEVRMLFEVGGSSHDLTQAPAEQPVEKEAAHPEPAPASAPASAPTTAPAERSGVIVHWGGQLRVEPVPADTGEKPRRHLEALGTEVKLWRGDEKLVCGRLEYHDENKQLWLHPAPGGRVEFARGEQLAGSAQTIYMDQERKVVKLIGDVDFTSAAGSGGRRQAIRCALWGELHLADKPRDEAEAGEAPLADWMSAGGLQSATFVGAASVDLGEQTLSAERIDVTFADGADQASIQTALEKTVALGDVRLEQRDESLQSDRLEILFGLTDAKRGYPRQMDALGSVHIKRGRAWLRGQKVHAAMDPGDAAAGGPEFVLRTLEVIGDAAMSDPTRKNQLAARGERIFAEFSGENELQRGTVFGTPQRHALVHGFPYTVRGERVDLEWDGLHVAGPSWLRFEATRSLQGRQRSRRTPIQVTSTESLDVDLEKNTVHLAGDVVAVNGDESLHADELTLLLEDAKQAAPTGPRLPGWLNALVPACSRQSIQAFYVLGPQLWRQAQSISALVQRPGQAPAGEARQRRDWLDRRGEMKRAIRKEPLRLLAKNALIQVESLEPGETKPVTHSSIGAPRLEIDIVGRNIETQGETTLLVVNRRLRPETASQGEETFGLPSAMVTRGPSQTVMRCTKGMTYALGSEGPERSDSAVFDGNVRFIHVAGREMVRLEEMLPEVHSDPGLLAQLKSRNTSLDCDRLECGFLVAGAEASRAGAMSSRDTRLKWLLASGNAELRDEREVLAKQPGSKTAQRWESVVRTVFAHQLDFDLEQRVVRVLGSAAAKARIYEENPDSAEARILVGEEFSIDLQNRTVRSGPSHGTIGR
ncbi:MAG: hypothetical protein KBH81_11670 [Phycisphaerae bacterium]|nr:hypothetical protein [Phycisphaerae bacterium]